jgi:hypothetical protein
MKPELNWLGDGVCADTVERFHIMTHLLFVLAQNILNNEDSWILSFAYVCLVDPGSSVSESRPGILRKS